MDANITKLARILEDEEIARLLVGAGYDNPRKIRNATDKDLLSALGGKRTRLSKVRERLARQK